MERETDEARFERAYTAAYAPILAFALRRTETHDDAIDVTAETFLIAWRRLDQLPTGLIEARLWLFGVARRVLANQRRSRRRQAQLNEKLAAQPISVPTDSDGRLAEAFAGLSADDQDLLVLVATEGLRPADLAAVLAAHR